MEPGDVLGHLAGRPTAPAAGASGLGLTLPIPSDWAELHFPSLVILTLTIDPTLLALVRAVI